MTSQRETQIEAAGVNTWLTPEELAERLSICATHAKDSPDNWTHLNPFARTMLRAASAEIRRLCAALAAAERAGECACMHPDGDPLGNCEICDPPASDRTAVAEKRPWDRQRACIAAGIASNKFGQWVPQHWMELFMDAYEAAEPTPRAKNPSDYGPNEILDGAMDEPFGPEKYADRTAVPGEGREPEPKGESDEL